MNQMFGDQCPWPVTFSYARAIQQPALDYWAGDSSRISEAQTRLLKRAQCNGAASLGEYSSEMEKTLATV